MAPGAKDKIVELPEGATLTVLHRGDAVPGALLTPHLEDLPAAPRDHVWACGEQSLATAARRRRWGARSAGSAPWW